MTRQICHVERKIRKTLKETDLDWSIETGSKHIKVMVSKRLLGVITKGRSTAKNEKDIIRKIEKVLAS